MIFIELLSGVISGMILFQTAIVAPVVFTTLDAENASKFLRKIFPRFFMVIFILGISALIVSSVFLSIQGIIIAAITAISMFISYLVVPATNKARDEERSKAFRRLHTLTVVLTLFTLLANLSWILPI
jgi:magnesium-transporting ATPase (P-type)